MKRKSLAILVVGLVLIMNFFIVIQNQYVPENKNIIENKPDNLMVFQPNPNELPISSTSNDNPYPDQLDEIGSSESTYLSADYFRYKDFVFNNINNSISFILSNLKNSTDGGFYEYVNLTAGGQNNTKKYTSNNALMVISLVDVYLENQSLNYLQQANETMEFLLKNLYYNLSVNVLGGFVNYIENNGVSHSNTLYTADNALAILALLKLYEITQNTTLVKIANQTLTYMNQILWDSEYEGYFQNNASINGSKYTEDNLLAIMANLEFFHTYYYDYEDQINALIKAEKVQERIFNNLSISNGLILNSSRNWTISTFANSTKENSLGILALLKFYDSTSNQTYIRMAENISIYLRKNLYNSIFQGFNYSISNTTKLLESNSWAVQAYLELYEKTENITYYLQGRNVSFFLENYLWDSINQIYNYSVDSGAAAQNWTIKYTRANTLAIEGLLKYKFPKVYLTRANTTMRLLLEHNRPDNVGFYKNVDRNHGQYGTSKFELTADDFLSIMSLSELSIETNNSNFVTNVSYEIYNRINSTFFNTTEGSFKIGFDEEGKFINESTLIDNTYALLGLSELYKITNNITYLQIINKTWYYINNSLWDNIYGGYYNQSTGQINRNSFDHFLIILANLEVANISSAMPNLQNNATKMANYTLQLINNNMWDNNSWGYYTSANQSWGIDSVYQNKLDAKKLDVNSLSIITQLKYLELFPTDINSSVYSNRINQTVLFLENYLWYDKLGGFFDFCNHNGSIIGLNQSTADNSWAVLAYCDLYGYSNNYSYYLKSEEILNFINFYLWDFESGGYFIGYYDQEIVLRNIKTTYSEFTAIRALLAVSRIRNQLPISPLISIQFNTTKIHSFGRYIDANILVYDTDCNKLNNSSAHIFLSGFQDNLGFSPVYGLGQKFNYTSKNSNLYNFSLNISQYTGIIYINPVIITNSYGVSWNLFSLNRSFSTYISRAFAVISSLTGGSYDYFNYGFYTANGTNLNKTSEDNFLAIITLSEFVSSTGLNIGINWSQIAYDQILTNYSIDSLNFLLNNFSFGNSTIRGFVTNGNYNGSQISNETTCKDNAWAIIALHELYDLTKNTTYLDIANATWKYLNTTFWDSINSGYNSTNDTAQQTKNLYDNFLAILANLKIASNNYYNQTIRNKALELANFTLNRTVSLLWDSSIYGFFSDFNYTWQPLHNIDEKSTIINSLAILSMIKYLELYPNDVNNNTYYNRINQTTEFMLNNLWDSGYLGFFSYYNASVGINNTNKTLKDNSFAILAFSELYDFTKNYTHYMTAEKTSFFLNTYFWEPLITAGDYANKSSIYGYVGSPNVDTFSSLTIVRSLIKLYSIRQNLKNPPQANNFTVKEKIVGKIDDIYEIELEFFDDNGAPLQNATAFAIVYSRDQIFNMTNIADNRYRVNVNVSQLSFTIQINVLIFNKSSFSAGFYTFEFYREFPIYLQIAHDTINRLRNDFWDDLTYADGFYRSASDTSKYSYDNFLMMEAILDLNNTLGPILYSMNWYANNTYDKLIDRIYSFVNSSLRANQYATINNSIVKANVTGFIVGIDDSLENPENQTQLIDNSMAVITLLEMYNKTGNDEYLRRANETWLYLNATFWDSNNSAYMSTNNTNANITRDIFGNFLAIMAALGINQTVEINSTIRQNAFHMANLTFYLLNNTKNVWDPNIENGGGYFSEVNITETGYWNITNSNKTTSVNALGILTLLKFYEITGDSTYLNQSNYLANLMYEHLWDHNETGFYAEVTANWSLTVPNDQVIKYASPNTWAVKAFYELFNITTNYTMYYQAETIMSYLNSFYLNFQYVDNVMYFLGFRDLVNKSNFAGPYSMCYSNALLVQILVEFFNLINSTFWQGTTSPWLKDNTNFIPGTDPPNGDIMNVTLSINYNQTQSQNNVNVTLNIIGYETIGSSGIQRFIYRVNATFNSSGNDLYIGEYINLTYAEDIYVVIFGLNASSPALWNIYHVDRLKTSLFYQLFGFPTSPIALKNKRILPDFVPYADGFRWKEFILGEDRMTINVTYGGEDFSFGQPITRIEDGRVNFEILNPDGSLYVNRTVLTRSNGIATISFGPTDLTDDAVGIYNVTITAQRGPSNTDPKTWYGKAVTKMYIQVGYGIYIAQIESLTPDVAQGDLLQCNLTLKNDRKYAAYINITAHGNVFIENSSLVNYLVDVGYTKQIIYVKVDERTIPNMQYTLTVNLIFEEKYVSNETLSILVKNSLSPTQLGIPIQIAEGDLRYAIFKIKNEKQLVDLNYTIEVFCPQALNYVRMNETLTQNAESYVYIPLTVKNIVPYDQFSGIIKISWVNYSQDFSFYISVTPDLAIGSVVTPISLYQDQTSLLTVEINNFKSTPVQILVAVVGTDGFQPGFLISHIDAFSSRILAIPCIFNTLPWDIGLKYLQIQVYIITANGLELAYSRVFMTTVIMSIPNILLLYAVPAISISVITILLLNRVRKIKEVEKKKIMPETAEKKKDDKLKNKRKKAPSPL
ncbi:MAG: hypothetical protein ACTSRG_10140 [Candidatus Helarchaeota archaeon]